MAFTNHSAGTSFTKYSYGILGFTWVAVQSFLFWENGIFTHLEAVKYINEAHCFLQNGSVSTGNFYLYFTEIALIALAVKLKTGYLLVVLVQWMLNALATVMFYKMAFHFLRNQRLATIATFLFIINIPYQIYNSFLYTESLFYSLTIIYSSWLIRGEKATAAGILLAILFLFLLSVTRPTGILFFGATAAYVFFRFMAHWKGWQKGALIVSSFVIFILIINQLWQSGGELDLMLPYVKENIICGVNKAEHADIKLLNNDRTLTGLAYYILHNPGHFIHLALLKTEAFFGMMRSYYSLTHNIMLALFYYPLYVLSFLGISRLWRSKKSEVIYALTVIFLFWLTSALTCDDWHNRFILTVVPFLFVLGTGFFSKRIPDDSSPE